MALSISSLQDATLYLYAEARVTPSTQTGNIVLLSQSLVERKWSTVIHYLIPLGFFAMGIVVAEGIRQKYKNVQRIHWRQLVLLMEMLLLLVVGFLPTACDLLANAMVSFACAMQVQTFHKSLTPFASTMYRQYPKRHGISVCLWKDKG